MVLPKRAAQFVATLVYADEPQVVHLMSKTVPVVAVAIPSDDGTSKFLAVTATRTNWMNYLHGASDLRYLFTFPSTRMIYTFDLHNMKNNRVLMTRWEQGIQIPDEYLPEPQFFARFHTEVFDAQPISSQQETLLVDGDWELQEFGNFYQRYSDVYAFLVALMNWNDAAVGLAIKDKIKSAFAGKPFEGGSSYLHFFSDLFSALRPGERLSLDKVKYASPGFVDVSGSGPAFQQVETNVSAFLERHSALRKEYNELRSMLSRAGLLRIAGHQFLLDHPLAGAIKQRAETFSQNLSLPDFNLILSLADDNALVAAKILLSYYRRVDEAATYFAQGRVTFD